MDRSPREELAELTASVRAYLVQLADSGADGVLLGGARSRRPELEATGADEGGEEREPAPPRAPVPAPPDEHERIDTSERDEAVARALALADEPPAAPRPAARGPSEAEPKPPAPAREVRALSLIADEVGTCTRCKLAETRTHTVFARGNPGARLAFVGEGPGAEEDAQGVPFVGRAGQLLDRMIVAMGLDPAEDVYVCNIVKCRPPDNRRPEPDEIAACMPYLREQLAGTSAEVVVALGNTAASALLETRIGITKLRGTWKLYDGRIPLMPTYHPSYLLRPSAQQRTAKREAWEDLQSVMAQLGLARTEPKRGDE